MRVQTCGGRARIAPACAALVIIALCTVGVASLAGARPEAGRAGALDAKLDTGLYPWSLVRAVACDQSAPTSGPSTPLPQFNLAVPTVATSGAATGSGPHKFGHRSVGQGLSYLRGRSIGIVKRVYPASYDLRSLGRVTPVKNQSPHGTCWAFAAIGSMESNLRRIEPFATWDLSEDHLVYFSGFYPGKDPYSFGGSSFMPLAYLARWGGPVTEAQDPYNDNIHPNGLSPSKHLQEAIFVPPRTSAQGNDAIKAAVMTYGAVDVDLYADPGMSSGTTSSYWREATDSYYYTGGQRANHDVAIVGWNDGYSAGNFSTTPPGNGAFIVRNSWGPGWGEGGYCYVSYYDTRIGYGVNNMVFNGVEPANNYLGIYQYDPYGYLPGAGPIVGNVGWFANVFTARSNDNISAVSFYTPLANCSYQVSVGASLTSTQQKASGTLTSPGYHTVKLGTQYPMTSGQRFAVAVKLTVPDAGYRTPIPVETPISGYSNATADPGQSYFSTNGSTWTDLTSVSGLSEANVCLKAFASARATGQDLTPPTTTDNTSSTWHRAPFTVSLTANDNSGGSGVAWTRYRINNAGGWWLGSSISFQTPSNHLNDGIHSLAYYSQDNAGNTESPRGCQVRIDTQAPGTSVNYGSPLTKGVDGKWHNYDIHFALTAQDPLPPTSSTASLRQSSGVARTQYVVPGGSTWKDLDIAKYHLVSRADPNHSNDGSHVWYLRSIDAAGNVEAARSVTVFIDTNRPRTRALRAVTVKRNQYMRLYFKVLDTAPNSGKATVQIYVRKGTRATGKVVLRTPRAPIDVNSTYYFRTRCRLQPGGYRFWVYATDAAGNRQSEIGWGTIRVRR